MGNGVSPGVGPKEKPRGGTSPTQVGKSERRYGKVVIPGVALSTHEVGDGESGGPAEHEEGSGADADDNDSDNGSNASNGTNDSNDNITHENNN
jgi:hypothetical protein